MSDNGDNGEAEATAAPEPAPEPKQVFEGKKAEPGQVFDFTTRDGSQAKMKANKDGVVTPQSVEQAQALEAFGLPAAKKEG